MIKLIDKLMMTAGPTYVREDVRNELGKKITNPDVDLEFFEFYKDTCEKLGKLMKTKNRVLIMSGEGILGLEAACASLIEKGDKVLCIDNGIFGRGFGDFAKIYGAEVTYFTTDYRRGVDVEKLKEFLKENNDFKCATVVGCETPSGISNELDKIGPLLDSYGIISIADVVSSVGGDEVKVDEWKIDIALSGSQKCISSTPGLTIVSVSDRAWKSIKERKTPVIGFYCNLAIWEDWYEKKWFPYTQSVGDIYGLRKAVDNILEENNYLERHSELGERVRKSIVDSGLELYPKANFSNVVTTVVIPEGIEYKDIFNTMLENGVMISGAFDVLEGKVFRIGNMGENAREDRLYLTLKALDKTMRKLGVDLKKEIHKAFV